MVCASSYEDNPEKHPDEANKPVAATAADEPKKLKWTDSFVEWQGP